jgi:hypothetical protein
MADTLQSVFIGGAAGFVSAVVTYFSTRAKTRLELAVEYDKKLQDSRLEAYKKLWAMLEPLARFGRDKTVTHEDLRGISDRSRAWYFREGGIYLTRASRGPYFRWKELMQPLLDNNQFADQPKAPIPETELDEVISAGSTLRTSLSDDIGTKRASWL